MSTVRPNPQQEAVIDALGCDVVVRAGAGTGKTKTLALRFAEALTSNGGWPGAEIDQILTITFTNKAAAELVSRVRGVLLDSGDVERSRRLDEAWVSTIDSFCSRLLRRYSLEAEVDPGFSVIGDVEGAVLRDRAFAKALQLVCGDGGEGADLLRGFGPELLREGVGRVVGRMRAMGCVPEDIVTAPDPPLERMADRFCELAESYVRAVKELGESPNATQSANIDRLLRVRELLASGELGEREWARCVLEGLPQKKISKGSRPKEIAAECQTAIEELELALGTAITRPHARAFLRLVRGFDHEYRAAKRAKGLLDFGDLVEEVQRLFESRPDIADDVAKRFMLIMVDEFQDTNRVQSEALGPLRRNNLCVVGDDQQSIYGFRYADVRLFEEMMDKVDPYPMTINYRSHADVLGAINGLFASEFLLGDRLQPLLPGRKEQDEPTWPEDAARVEFLVSDSYSRVEMSAREAQAQIVAERVAELIRDGTEAKDIVVLMRALSGASTYAEALRSRGVSTFLASGETFFDTPEIADIRALIKAVIVPRDDAAMARVLSGPLVSLSPDTLLDMKRTKGISLWEAAAHFADRVESDKDATAKRREEAQHIREALDNLHNLRLEHERVPLSRFVVQACETFDYDLTLLAAGTLGRRAWGNVLKLSRMAAELERVEPIDAGSFLEYLDRHEKNVSKEPSAVASAGDDVVRIMSVHAAKGLEFPVVVVADMARSLSRGEGAYFLLESVEGEVRLALKSPLDGTPKEGCRDSWYAEISEYARSLETAEEKRIFYVACTRAREALVLVGDARVSAPTPTSLAGLLLLAMGSPQESGEAELPGGARVHVVIEHSNEWDFADSAVVPVSESSVESTAIMKAIESLDAQTECESAWKRDTLPAQLSYSSLHQFDRCPHRFLATTSLGLDRLQKPGQGGGLSLGSAVHAVLEVSEELQPDSRTIESVATAFALDRIERERLTDAVAAVSTSDVAQRVRSAQRCQRELPFVLKIDDSRLEGSIDLICWEGDKALIVDYKTGLDEELSRSPGRKAGHRLQAECYALAALETGAKAVEVLFVFAEQEARVDTHAFASSDTARLRSEMEARVSAISDGMLDPPTDGAGEYCRECPVNGTLCSATR